MQLQVCRLCTWLHMQVPVLASSQQPALSLSAGAWHCWRTRSRLLEDLHSGQLQHEACG